MVAERYSARGSYFDAPAPFAVRYSRKALLILCVFGCALLAFGQYLLNTPNGGITYRLAGAGLAPAGLIVMAHAVRYVISPRVVTILPTGLAYHGMVMTFRAGWSQIAKVGAGQGDEAADSSTFHATGPFGVFGKFAINELLIDSTSGDLATIADALDRARSIAPPPAPFGNRHRLPR